MEGLRRGTLGSLGACMVSPPHAFSVVLPLHTVPPRCVYTGKVLGTSEVEDEAEETRDAVVRQAADLSKFKLATLMATLMRRRLDTNGSKSEIVKRVRDMLQL